MWSKNNYRGDLGKHNSILSPNKRYGAGIIRECLHIVIKRLVGIIYVLNTVHLTKPNYSTISIIRSSARLVIRHSYDVCLKGGNSTWEKKINNYFSQNYYFSHLFAPSNVFSFIRMYYIRTQIFLAFRNTYAYVFKIRCAF